MALIQLYLTNRGMIEGCTIPLVELAELGLYTNDLALSKGFDPSLLTEATFSGYTRLTLILGNWTTPPVIDSDGNASSYYPQQTFTKSGVTGNATIFGYFFGRISTHEILFAQRFDDGPFAMTADGSFIRVTPRYAVGTPIFPP